MLKNSQMKHRGFPRRQRPLAPHQDVTRMTAALGDFRFQLKSKAESSSKNSLFCNTQGLGGSSI
jgi:hypothetical protein